MAEDDPTLPVGDEAPGAPASTTSEQSILFNDAKRLLAFKRQNITRQNETPCPECTELVSIHAKKCRHCGSEIGEYTEAARESLDELRHLTDELSAIHAREMQRHAEAARVTPLRERALRLMRDESLRSGFRALAPAGLLLFSALLCLRMTVSGLAFWAAVLGGGALSLALLRRARQRHYLTVDLFHLALLIGLGLFTASAVFRPMPFWPEFLSATVEVTVETANVRAGPTTEAEIVVKAGQGDRLRVLDRDGNWFEVQTDSGDAGWVHADLVR